MACIKSFTFVELGTGSRSPPDVLQDLLDILLRQKPGFYVRPYHVQNGIFKGGLCHALCREGMDVTIVVNSPQYRGQFSR